MRKVTVSRMRERYAQTVLNFPNNLRICIYIYIYIYMLVPNERVFLKQFFVQNFSAQCVLRKFSVLAVGSSTNDYSCLLQQVGSKACFGVFFRTGCLCTQRDWIGFRWLRSDRKELKFSVSRLQQVQTSKYTHFLNMVVGRLSEMLGTSMPQNALVQETVVSIHPVYIFTDFSSYFWVSKHATVCVISGNCIFGTSCIYIFKDVSLYHWVSKHATVCVS